MSKREVKIYCPKCAWEPQQSSRWWCGPKMGGCGYSWNTFDTGGVCPECGKAWEETACLSCHRMSAHRAWYHEFTAETSEATRKVALPMPPSVGPGQR